MGSHVQLTKISALIFLRLKCSASYVCLSNLMLDGYKLQAPGPQKVDTLAKTCLKNVGKTIINHPPGSPGITISQEGGMVTIPSHGWFMIYPHDCMVCL